MAMEIPGKLSRETCRASEHVSETGAGIQP
jgi:hypothetical protein